MIGPRLLPDSGFSSPKWQIIFPLQNKIYAAQQQNLDFRNIGRVHTVPMCILDLLMRMNYALVHTVSYDCINLMSNLITILHQIVCR